MTLSTTTSRMTYTGNGSTTAFPFTFKIFASSDLVVTQRDADTDVETTLTLTTHYSVSGVGESAGGTVTLVTAPADGDILTIRRVRTLTQTSAFPTGGAYSGSAMEAALDKLVMVDQQQQDEIDRSFKLPTTLDPADYDVNLPVPEVGQVITWAAGGPTFSTLDDSDNVTLPGDSRTVASLTAFLANNAVFNVKDYGATGDGSTEDSATIQAAEDARQAAGGLLYFPAGEYKVSTAVICDGAQSMWYAEPGTTILCYTTSGPCVRFISNGQASGVFHRVKIGGFLKIKRMAAAHRHPLITLGDETALDVIDIDNLELDANFLAGDGLLLDRVWEGSIRMLTLEHFHNGTVGTGIGVVWRATDLNAGNIHFDSVQTTTCPIVFLLNETPGPGNTINSVHFNNCKQARGTFLSTNKFYAGTVAAGGAALGASTINVTAGQGTNYAAGDWITVATGASDVWVCKVASVSTDEITIVTDGAHADGLPFALSAGDPVIVGNWHTILGPNVKSAVFTTPHFERGNGVLGVNATTVSINLPAIGADLFRVAYLAKGCQGWDVVKPENVVAYGASAVILHIANDVNNARNRVVGPIKVTGTLPTVVQNDAGNQAAFVGRGGGYESAIGHWVQLTTVAANQSAVQLTGPTGVATYGVRMRSDGCAFALNFQSRVARSAGTATATLYKNGVATTLTATIDGTNTFNVLTEHVDGSQFVLFNNGDILDVRITTDASWAPTANDIVATVYVCQ